METEQKKNISNQDEILNDDKKKEKKSPPWNSVFSILADCVFLHLWT